jgi:transposase, IS5 family
MRGQAGFFDVDDRSWRLRDLGDPLEAFRVAVNFETFRPELNAAPSYSGESQGGVRRFIRMFKILVI